MLLFRLAETQAALPTASIRQAVQALQAAEGVSEMEALKRVARERGIGKSAAYREFQREGSRGRPETPRNQPG